MKYCYHFILLIAVAVQLSAKDTNDNASGSTLVRLVKVSHSPSELQSLIATFEPIRIAYAGGGWKGPGTFPPPAIEKVTGQQFTVAFIKQPMNAHEQTLWHVIDSCTNIRGHATNALSLHLVLSIPTAVAKQLASDQDRDFDKWIIQSVEVVQ